MSDLQAPTTDRSPENWEGRLSAAGDAQRFPRSRAAFRRLRRNRMAFGGLVVLFIALSSALLAPWVSPYDPKAIAVMDALQNPGRQHLMGTDNLGRDQFSRVIWGIRMSAVIAGVSITVAAIIGVLLGLVSGFFRGKTDEIIMRAMDILYAFPDLLLALALVATFGTGLWGLIIAIAIGRIPGFARITRGTVLSLRENEYITAARTLGLPDWKIIARHILPNGIAPILVMVSISLALAILVEASLSFLGLGIQPPTPSLGGLLKESLAFMDLAPWMAIFPGLTIALIIFSLNLFGDGLRDVLDPNLK
ncbi:MAG: ABC transporter permease [Thermomicrobiales bacterium]